MKQQRVILLLALLAVCGSLWLMRRTPPSERPTEETPPVNAPRRIEPIAPEIVPEIRLWAGRADGGLSAPPDGLASMAERTMQQRLPSLFADKTGSYSTRELRSGGGTQDFTVSTGWVAPLFDRAGRLPVLSLRVIKNPATGAYELKGAGIALPGSGLEAGAESELSSEEYKAVIQWKKSF